MEKYVITMLGEKDHGKSTLIGNLLIATGNATDHRINEAKKYSKDGRFEPGYILDSFEEERSKEMTIDTTRAELAYKNNLFELIDVPGHLELIKNMVSGASHGEIAVLMVSVKEGEGLRPQTKRHVYISNILGIKALIVAINKMDLAGYSELAFKKMQKSISEYLSAIGFSQPVSYVPISAYVSDNLTKPSENMTWYKGRPLIAELEALGTSNPRANKSGTRAIVQDVVEQDGKEMLFCYLSSGSVKLGQKIRIQPSSQEASIAELYLKGEKTAFAPTGSNIAIILAGNNELKRGFVISGLDERPHTIRKFNSLVFFIKKLETSSVIELKVNNNSIAGKIIDAKELISPITGKAKMCPKTIPPGNAAKLEIELGENYPMEKFSDYKELGRFALYCGNVFCGIGIVL